MEKNLPENLAQNIGIGVASLTFGVALSIFIYSVVSGRMVDVSAWLLFCSSFFLMLRFWWRYVDLFVRSLPSQTFWQFFFDFTIPFFAILAVLFVGSLQIWAILTGTSMLASAVRCGLSWRLADEIALPKLRRTLFGAVGMLVLMMAVVLCAFLNVSQTILASITLCLILFFILYAAKKP